MNIARLVIAILLLIPGMVFSQTTPDRQCEGELIEVNGVKLFVEIKGQGEPLLLIAGGPGFSHFSFHPHFDVLEREFKVIYFDAYGTGKSDRADSPDSYSLQKNVEDVEGLRKALAIKSWHVLGHSYGGMVAQVYTLKYPHSVKKLILSSTLFSAEMWQAGGEVFNHEMKNLFPERWQKILALREQGRRSNDPEIDGLFGVPMALVYFYDGSNQSKLMGNDTLWNSDVFYAIAGENVSFMVGGDIYDFDTREQLKNLKMPLLIMAGRWDRLVAPRYSIKFKKYAPQARFVIFEKSGHFPYVEEPEEYFTLVREFLFK